MQGTGRFSIVVVAALLAVVFAGCVGSPAGEDPDGDGSGTGRTGRDGGTGREGGSRLGSNPHVHDLWYGADQITLMDENVEVMVHHNHLFDEPPRDQHTHGCDNQLVSSSQGGSVRFGLPPGHTVIPGTAELELILEWDAQIITGLRFFYRAAGRGHADGHTHGLDEKGPGSAGYNEAPAVEAGAPFRIPVGPMEVDDGHALRSKWAFFMCASDGPGVSVAQGTVQAFIVAHRAEGLPMDPPHPDHWQGNDTIRLAARSTDIEALSVANKGEDAWVQVAFDQGKIVPPRTERLMVEVKREGTGLAGLDPGDVLLYWRDPSEPGWRYHKETPLTSGADRAMFRVIVTEDAVDSYYATVTEWDLWVRILSGQSAATPLGHMGTPHHWEGKVTVTVDAERSE